MFSLKGKTALITGASGGIGGEIASQMYSLDAKVVLTGTNEQKLKDLTKVLGKNSTYIVSDLENDDDLNNLFEKSENFTGQVDILINNAGITSDNLFLRMKKDQWSKVIDINLNSTVKLTQKFLKGMIKRRFGRIIFISSVIGFTGNAGQANYSSSKAALSGFAKSISFEVASRGVTCNVIAPGFIKSPMTEKLNEEQQIKILNQIPISRFGEPKDVAAACIYLSSEESSFVTGSTLHVNGGMAMF